MAGLVGFCFWITEGLLRLMLVIDASSSSSSFLGTHRWVQTDGEVLSGPSHRRKEKRRISLGLQNRPLGVSNWHSVGQQTLLFWRALLLSFWLNLLFSSLLVLSL